MFLPRVISALEEFGVKYAIAGGHAVAFHGAVRGTLDIDVVIRQTEKDYVSAEKALNSIGLTSRLPVDAQQVFRFRKEYIEKRSLIAWSFQNADLPSEIVNILLNTDLRKIKVHRKSYGRFRINIVSIADLILMKRRSGRPQDLEDIQALEEIRRMKK